MTNTTYDKVKRFIGKYGMIKEGDLVAAGVSGGADSVCLLHMLRRFQDEVDFRLLAVHVDHGVRSDSAADAAYVEQLCHKMGVPFCLRKVDMNAYAKENGLSSEEAGRMLRYGAFDDALAKWRQEKEPCKIAVAHTCNDRAETMLFHMFRGSGLKGLASIQPVRERVVRPLLCLERREIEAYLSAHKLAYCQDSTNAEDLYVRNRIRHHILPYADREICSGAVTHMGELAEILSETERYLEQQAKRLYAMYVKQTGDALAPGFCIDGKGLLSEDPVMYKRVLLLCMESLTPYRKDITGRHITDLVRLMAKEGSKELCLPYGIRAYKEYDKLYLIRETPRVETQNCPVCKVEPPMEIFFPGEGVFSFAILEKGPGICEKEENIPQNRYTKWFDYDKITTSLLLRTRRQGDFLTIDAARHTKSVKQYMINEKIPKMQRDSMHLLADGAHILWIPGYRISQNYKVDGSTRRILQVRFRGGNDGGTN